MARFGLPCDTTCHRYQCFDGMHGMGWLMRFFGEFQSVLRVGNRSFLGIGETPAESRKMAIEAADLKLSDRLPLGTYSMVTEHICNRREVGRHD